MELIVNYNDDTLTIDDALFIVRNPVEIRNILEELLHRLNPTNVSLVVINEDYKYTVAEW